MSALTWGRYLLGQREAIQCVATSGGAFWTGMILVILTAIPRNYDQSSVFHEPLRWCSDRSCSPLFRVLGSTESFTPVLPGRG